MIASILSGGWGWLVALISGAVAMAGMYFTGKKVAATKTQASADVAAAKKEADQAKATAQAQQKINSEAANVREDVSRISDGDVDERLRKKWKRIGDPDS